MQHSIILWHATHLGGPLHLLALQQRTWMAMMPRTLCFLPGIVAWVRTLRRAMTMPCLVQRTHPHCNDKALSTTTWSCACVLSIMRIAMSTRNVDAPVTIVDLVHHVLEGAFCGGVVVTFSPLVFSRRRLAHWYKHDSSCNDFALILEL